MIYAHSVKGRPKDDWESLEDHARRVAQVAQTRAQKFGCADAALALGLLHDLGKAKPGFQRKLAGEENDISHSGEGARVLANMGPFAAVLAGAIAGHHGRLPNRERLRKRLSAAKPLDLPDWCDVPKLDWPARVLSDPYQSAYRLQFLVRMLYGVLCDADDRETGAFYAEVERRPLPDRSGVLTAEMRAAFDAHMAAMGGGGAVNDLRKRVLSYALKGAEAEPGLFTLTVPTGGGKTLTSLGFGLAHAARHGLDRIIYVIPYTSIVEQTADVFRGVFASLGSDVVLEHHSGADWDGEDESEAEQRKIMGTSWDVPIVVTTAVQFFESLHAARKKRCRKLPSLARSVIVVDEAQTMPLALLRPCLAALRELMDGYSASVVLSTATQPSLTRAGGFLAKEALEGAREIAPEPKQLFAELRRVAVHDVGFIDNTGLADRMRNEAQILCIVDNRSQARDLFDRIREKEGAAQLSTLMVPDHRRAVLASVRERLKAGQPVRLVSTSLIEAGVDVDFPRVLRASAGIDSIAQAAGRCNREGRLQELGLVEVFQSETPAPPAVEQFAEIGRRVIADHGDDPIGEVAVAAYFRRLWETYGSDALDEVNVGPLKTAGLLNAIRKAGQHCPFEDVEAAFQIIPDGERTAIVLDGDWGVGATRLGEARFASVGAVAKLVQPYTLNVPWNMWRALWDNGHLSWWEKDRFEEQFAVLQTSALYDDAAGLGLDETSGAVV